MQAQHVMTTCTVQGENAVLIVTDKLYSSMFVWYESMYVHVRIDAGIYQVSIKFYYNAAL